MKILIVSDTHRKNDNYIKALEKNLLSTGFWT